MPRASYAFAGSGDVDTGNASALLDDFLPRALGALYRPERVPRTQKALSGVIDWLEGPEVLGENGTVASDDLIASLLERREQGDDVALIVIWPEEPSEDEIALVTTAREQDIRVLSLGDAIDDLLWEPPAPEPDEPPAEETITPGGDIEDDLVQAAVGAIDGVAEQLAHSFTESLALFVRRIVRDELAKRDSAAAAPAAPAEETPAKPARASRASARGRASTRTETDEPSGRPPATAKFSDGDKATQTTPTTKYYVNEDGHYRLAKARPRRGETPVELTPAEVKRAEEQGIIDS